MSHEISRVQGIDEAYYAENPAWHSLGQVTETALTSQGAIRMAHLDWDVLQSPVYFDPDGDGMYQRANNAIVNYRADTNDVLGIVTKQYKIVQNIEAFDFMDSLLESGDLRYESAGALKGGRIVWLLARIPGDISIGSTDDVTRKYMLLYNSHDGTKSVRVSPTNVRVVCWNTLQVAISSRDNEVSIRHKGSIKDKLQDARKVLQIVNSGYDVFAKKAQILAETVIKVEDFEKLVSVVEPDIANPEEKDLKNLERRRDKIRAYFASESQWAMEHNLPITAWTALNAVTAHNTHGKKGRKNPERQFESCFIDAGARDSVVALDKALKIFV